MSRSVSSRQAWLPVSVAALVLAFGVTACGNSNDDGEQSEATASQSGTPTSGGSERDQKAAAAVMPRISKYFNSMNGAGMCANMTAAGQREVREWSVTVPEIKSHTCGKALTQYTRLLVPKGGRHKPVRIKALDINGDKAVVTMKGGLAGIRSVAKYKLAKQDGEWKLVDPVSGAETRRVP